MAASTMIAIPVVAFFMIVQKKMAAGLTSGAVKG
jgi:N,N'-diacetylchitobiose transport system permease protein